MHAEYLTLCMIGVYFSIFLLSADFFFSKSIFFKNSFSDTIRVSSRLDPDQAQAFCVRPRPFVLRVCNRELIFLFLNQNICCGCSKEPSH